MLMKTSLQGLVFLGLAATFSSPAVADENSSDTQINPWRHCGIGAAIFSDNPTAAAISNVIWDSGTTAVTSATLTPGSCSGEEVQVAQLIDFHYDALVMDIAAGQGEHVVSLGMLAGCSTGAVDEFVGSLQHGFKTVISDESYAQTDHAERAYALYRATITASQETSSCSI